MASRFTLEDCLVPIKGYVKRDDSYLLETHPLPVRIIPKHDCRTCTNKACKKRFFAVVWVGCEKWGNKKTTGCEEPA